MISISNYSLIFNTNNSIYYLEINEDIICPACKSAELIYKGRPIRKIIMPDEEKRLIKINRIKCKKCLTTHRVLPDVIVPYKRHCMETYNNVTNGAIDTVTCEENTITRIKAWWSAIQRYIKSIIPALKEKHNIDLSATKKLVQIVRILANSNLWPDTRSVLTAVGT